MKPKFSTGYLTQTTKNKKDKGVTNPTNNDHSSPLLENLDNVFEKLMNCPIKRKLVLKLIESEKDNIEEYKKKLKEKESKPQNASPLQKLQKKQACESPTALLRRRVLEQQNSSCSSRPNSAILELSSNTPSPIPFQKLLDNVVVFVEVNSKGEDKSNGVKALMASMGANVKDGFTRDVTHVVFKVRAIEPI